MLLVVPMGPSPLGQAQTAGPFGSGLKGPLGRAQTAGRFGLGPRARLFGPGQEGLALWAAWLTLQYIILKPSHNTRAIGLADQKANRTGEVRTEPANRLGGGRCFREPDARWKKTNWLDRTELESTEPNRTGPCTEPNRTGCSHFQANPQIEPNRTRLDRTALHCTEPLGQEVREPKRTA